MKNIHASEQAIQEYAMDGSGIPEEKAHIESCSDCLSAVKTYQLLFTGIQEEPEAAFNFDLSGLVMGRLPKPAARLSADRFIAGFLLLFIGCFIAMPIILFRQYIFNMFSGISPFFIFIAIGSAICILIYKVWEMYKKYLKEMQILNFK
jgi:hypothetical protein